MKFPEKDFDATNYLARRIPLHSSPEHISSQSDEAHPNNPPVPNGSLVIPPATAPMTDKSGTGSILKL